jgi:type II secretory pathway pseudopilin PulG
MKSDKAQTAGGKAGPQPSSEQGFMLLGLIVAVALILIALSVAASKEAFTLRREREVESARRANQYVRAIQLYYKKFGRYPATIEQLENSNNIRFLRQRYVDPLTGKADYRLIPVGQNQTTVKGFFGEPLAGIASAGLGAAAGMQSNGIGGAAGASGAFGASGATGPTGATGPAGSTNASGSSGAFGGTSGAFGGSSGAFGGSSGAFGGSSGAFGGSSGAFGGSSGLGSAAGMQSPTGMGLPGSTGPFMGVGSSATGNSIITPNEQTTYQTWEFLYDPRIETLKLAAALNGGADALGGGALGQSPSSMGQPPNGFGPSQSGFGQPPSNTEPSPSTPSGTNQQTSP